MQISLKYEEIDMIAEAIHIMQGKMVVEFQKPGSQKSLSIWRRALIAMICYAFITAVPFFVQGSTGENSKPLQNCGLYQKTVNIGILETFIVYSTSSMNEKDYLFWDWTVVAGDNAAFSVKDGNGNTKYSTGLKAGNRNVIVVDSVGKWQFNWYNDNWLSSIDVAITAKFCNPIQVSATPASGYVPLTVAFSTSGEELKYFTFDWEFGDSSTGSGTSPTHQYSNPGSYYVKLNVVDVNKKTPAYGGVLITAKEKPPIKSVTITPSTTSGDAPLTVSFSSNVDGGVSPFSYSWNYGDGSTDTDSTTQHTYQNAGTYTVTLTVTDDAGQTGSSSVVISAKQPFLGVGTGGSGAATFIMIAVGIVALVLILLLVLFLMKKKKKEPQLSFDKSTPPLLSPQPQMQYPPPPPVAAPQPSSSPAPTVQPQYQSPPPPTAPPQPPPTQIASPPTVIAGSVVTLVFPNGSKRLVSENEVIIGREDLKSMLPADKSMQISGKHLRIFKLGRSYYVEDGYSGKPSTNGTQLNGTEIKGTGKHRLNPGDVIGFASAAEIKIEK